MSEREGLGKLLDRLLTEHWPNSGVNPWYLADLLREHDTAHDDRIRAEAWDEGKWAGIEEVKRMQAYLSPTWFGVKPEPFANPYATAFRAAADTPARDAPLDDSGRPVGSCNCARYGHARLCAHHTQEDFDAADRVRAAGTPTHDATEDDADE